ncbi:MAG TPA: hypothetical protein PKE06_18615 [Flavilitoribacter sp.]|nr:hypothetical protein [Flavilitoribacter sp.]HMQ91318.1 hypothetical protein [Flavilitoribacter sp.]
MKYFLATLYERSEVLFLFGALCLLAAVIFLILTRFTDTLVMGVNAWYKPFKFALSIGIYCWTMGWYTGYLGADPGLKTYAWAMVILLGFELAYIALQAGRGQLSHFNDSNPLYSGLYAAMAVAATAVALWTGYIGLLFFGKDFPELPDHYVWGIRTGIVIFTVFALEGFVMGSRMSHTIGGPDGDPGLPVVNWSTRYGDPRIAHFIGMHALQVLPILSWFLLKNTKAVLLAAMLYGLLAIWTLVQALQGRAIFSGRL